MSASNEMTLLEVPARIADLGFRMAAPKDWNVIDLPAEEVDFGEPAKFFPLAMVVAPWAMVLLTVAARPGFEDGTLQDWSLFLLSSQGIQPTSFGAGRVGDLQAFVGVGRQEQEGTWLEMRFAFFEDGGRLVYLGLLAPEALSASLDAVWKGALEGFVLDRPQGQRVPVVHGAVDGVVAEPIAKAEEPVAVTEEVAPEMPASPFRDDQTGFYAKADDESLLDPEHPIQARLRDQGVGLTPRLLDFDREQKWALIGAGAIGATMRVAFGWHVIDDGRRTLVLDPDGKIQIHFDVLQKQGRSVDGMLDDIQEEMVRSYEAPEFLRMEFEGIFGLAGRNLVVDGEAVEQVHMLTRWAKDSAMLRARVTADPASMRFAADYADVILKSVGFGEVENSEVAEERPENPEEKEWVRRARALEMADRLEEFEQVVREAVPSIHCAIATAHFYRDRWVRLKDIDPAKAEEARQKASDWAYTYASWATSGGEGTALSYERDQFLKTL